MVKALQGLGFSGQVQKVATNSGRYPETIFLKDFQRILVYGVKDAALFQGAFLLNSS